MSDQQSQAPAAPFSEYPKELRLHGVRMVVNGPEEERIFLDAPWPRPVKIVDPLETAKEVYLAHATAREAAVASRVAREQSEEKARAAHRAAAAQRDEQGRLDAAAAFRSAWGEEPPAFDEAKGAP